MEWAVYAEPVSRLRFPSAARKRGALGSLGDAGCGDVFVEPGREVVAHRDLAVLAVFFPEAQHAVIAQVAIIGHPEPGHGADAGAGVGQHAEHRAIAEAHNVAGIDRSEQLARLLDGELGGLAFDHAVFNATHGSERIKGDCVTLHERVEKVPQRGERLVCAEPARRLMYSPARPGVTWRSSSARSSHQLTAGDATVSAAGVLVTERGLEEFLGGEGGVGGLPQDDERRGRHRQRRGGAS